MADFSNDTNTNSPKAVNDNSEAKPEFGLLLREVSSLLPFVIVKEIAPIFRYSTEEIGEYEHQENPGYSFISSLHQKHKIHPGDVSKLTNALKIIDMSDVAEDVSNVFRRNREKAKVSALKKIFIEELKKTYRNLYNNVKTMPFKNAERFLVDQLFIERDIYLLIKEGIKQTWQKLESYHSMFDESKISSTRIVLSSKAGYGKSTLALKFLSDWTNNCKDSPLQNVEILIFLRLRELDDSVSIFKAIKKCLLSNNFELGQSEVEKIMRNSKSVALLLEGFDKYLRKGNPADDCVTNILKGRKFPDFRVILTTTLSCKPKFMDPTTAEVTLGGFDPEAQHKYIRKALAIDDEDEFAKVRNHINENPVIQNLSEVPFIFAMALHLIQQEKENKKIPFWFKSVTGFFRFVVGSIYEHKKDKMREDDLKNYPQFKDDHRKLDKVCFETLTEGEEVESWNKEDLEKTIGKGLYDHYIAVEIFVEGDVLDIDTSPHAPSSSLIELKTHTMFYHKLFMQWFAAHYIAQRETKLFRGYSNRHLKTLLDKKLNYTFMFACGINPDVIDEIVYFLRKHKSNELIRACRLEEEHGRR